MLLLHASNKLFLEEAEWSVVVNPLDVSLTGEWNIECRVVENVLILPEVQ